MLGGGAIRIREVSGQHTDDLGHEYQEARTQWHSTSRNYFLTNNRNSKWSSDQSCHPGGRTLPCVLLCHPQCVAFILWLPEQLLPFRIPDEKGRSECMGVWPPLHVERLISLDSPETSSTSPFQTYRKERDTLVLFCGSYSRGGQKNVVVNPYSLFQGLHTHPKICGDFQWKQKPQEE